MKAVVTYLNFDGNTRDAMKFYARCLGGDLSIMPFSDAPGNFPKEARDRVCNKKS
jgi:PhnB protein